MAINGKAHSIGVFYSPGLQVLRGIAAIAIVFLHLGVAESKYGNSDGTQLLDGFHVGAAGVDIFFVISGFVMMLVAQKAQTSPKRFIGNRLTRIYPNYWIYYGLILGFWLIKPGWVNASLPGSPDILSSFLLVPNSGKPLVSVAWTLEYELFFYSIFALALLASRKNVLKIMVTGLLLFTTVGYMFEPENILLQRITNPLNLEFASGAVLASLLFAKNFRWGWTAIPLSLLLLTLNQTGHSLQHWLHLPVYFERVINYGIPAVLLVFGVASMDKHKSIKYPELLTKIGDASYTLYLSHILVISALGRLWFGVELQETIPNLLFLSLLLIMAVMYALYAYEFIEKPLLSKTRKWLDS